MKKSLLSNKRGRVVSLAREGMIEELQANCDSWQAVYDLFNKRAMDPRLTDSLYGWHTAFDGPSLEEMYLTNVHPLSDESGELITINDFNSNKKG